jgi:hypothetical protein
MIYKMSYLKQKKCLLNINVYSDNVVNIYKLREA